MLGKPVCGSYDSIAWQRPSRFIFQAMEDTTLMEMDYGIMQEFANRSSVIGAHRSNIQLKLLEKAIAWKGF